MHRGIRGIAALLALGVGCIAVAQGVKASGGGATITITAPTNGEQFPVPALINLAATVDARVAVDRVEFFEDDVLVATDNQAPFEAALRRGKAGSFTYGAAVFLVGNVTLQPDAVAARVTVSLAPENSPPTVSLVKPLDGSRIAAASDIEISAEAADADGAVTQVEFYSTLARSPIAIDTEFPFTTTLGNVPEGSIGLWAVATDDAGVSTSSATVQVRVSSSNVAPSVRFVEPSEGARFVAPVSTPLEVEAWDVDGRIASVQFSVNGSAVGGPLSAPPYRITWSAATPGTYTLSALATDNRGAGASVTRTVTLVANRAPTVAFVAPSNGQQFVSGDPIPLRANASDTDGSVSRVEFRRANDSVLVGTGLPPRFEFSWNGAPDGLHTITARAIDDKATPSAPATLSVNVAPNVAPTVALSRPRAGNYAASTFIHPPVFAVGESIAFEANAVDANQNLSRVEFLRNGAVVATVTPTSPGQSVFTATVPIVAGWANATIQTLSARAVDAKGSSALAADVAIAIPRASAQRRSCNQMDLVPNGQGAFDCRPGSPRHTVPGRIEAERFDGGGQGVGHFRTESYLYFDMYRLNEVPIICPEPALPFAPSCYIGGDKKIKNGEWYAYSINVTQSGLYRFPARVRYPAPTTKGADRTGAADGLPALEIELRGDSGRSIRLHGNPVPTQSKTGQWLIEDLAVTGGGIFPVEIPAGEYVMFVRWGREIEWDWIELNRTATASPPPTSVITSPQQGAVFGRGAEVRIDAEVTGAIASTAVDFYVNGSTTPFAVDIAAPFSASWNAATAGSYTFRVRARNGAVTGPDSTPITISVTSNAAPTVQLSAPPDGLSVALGEAVSLGAAASDTDGTVASVEFLVNGASQTPPLTDATAPYAAVWTPVQAGTYVITARATDNQLATNVSAARTITVSGQAVSEAPDAPAAPAPLAGATQAGAVAGTFRVDETGSATYDMPLFMPPGSGGVMPQLAIQYSSVASDGYLGHGFALGGLSTISRCRKSVEHGDGAGPHPAVDFSANDQYCLDGQRLLLVAGTHGAAGAEYRTEIDSFQRVRIEQRGAVDLDPIVFLVESKDGSRRRYGETGARVTGVVAGDTRVVSWLLSSIEDVVANRITFGYVATGEPGELVPGTVSYRGGRVTFDYAPQSEPPVSAPRVVSYAGGVAVVRSRLLTGIRIEAEKRDSLFETLRNYKLTYEAVPNGGRRARLRQVLECAPQRNADDVIQSGETCYAPTRFTWADLPGTREVTTVTGDPRAFFKSLSSLKYGDIDGDGRADVVWLADPSSNAPDFLRMAYSAPTSAGLDFVPYGVNTPIDIVTMGNGYSDDRSWHLFDFNGDGREDLFYAAPNNPASPGSGRWVVRLSTASPGGRQSPPFGTEPISQLVNPTSDGTPIAFADTRTDGMLADFDGDGLADFVSIVRVGNAEQLQLRLMQRNPGFSAAAPDAANRLAYRFGPAIPITLPAPPSGNCDVISLDKFNRENSEAIDVNGDGYADLKLRSRSIACSGKPSVLFSPSVDVADLPPNAPDAAVIVPPDTSLAARLPLGSVPIPAAILPQSTKWELLRNPGVTGASSVSFVRYASFVSSGAGAVISDDADKFRVADVNGDGLADIVYKRASASTWYFRLNNGRGFEAETCAVRSGPGCVDMTDNVALSIQLLDFDGDGRLDFWRRGTNDPCRNGSVIAPNCFYRVMLWDGTAFADFSQAIVTHYVAEAGIDSEGKPVWHRFFADVDGDGLLDGLNIRTNNTNGAWEARRHGRLPVGGGTRVPLRNLLTRIDNGMGAVTDIGYQPLTHASVYQRDFDARLPQAGNPAGRGSPLFDVLAPNYVVNAVSSSAPASANGGSVMDHGALSTVYYRYAGMKMQAGGRGALGFRKVFSTDVQTRIETETTYGQRFPLSGVPLESRAVLRSSVRPIYFACDADSDGPDCHRVTPSCPTQQAVCDADAVPGIELSRTVDTWRWRERNASAAGKQLGAQVPLFVYRASSTKRSNAYASGGGTGVADGATLTTEVTEFLAPAAASGLAGCADGYDAFGNVCRVRVQRYAGTEGGALASEVDSTFWYADTAASWILGRVSKSIVATTRWSGGSPTTAKRYAEFDYLANGLLSGEHSQRNILADNGSVQSAGPLEHALSTYYSYDGFGNRIATFTCSRHFSESQCKNTTGVSMRPTDPLRIQRYVRVEYDSLGRYVDRTYGLTQGTADDAAVERLVAEVNRRTAAGDPLETTDVNGQKGYLAYEALGRKYWERSSSGVWTETRVTLCGASQCPVGGRYVVEERAAGAPRRWAVHDALGRGFVSITEGFGDGQWIGVQQRFDALGRVVGASEPYFALDRWTNAVTAAAGSTIHWATSEYDALGRVTRSVAADGGATTNAYSGLVTTTTLPANGNGDIWSRQQWRRTTRDATGEIASVEEVNGLTLRYGFDPFGNLTRVEQVVGGAVRTTTDIRYDALGRKVGMTDPDMGGQNAGSWFYAVNALGEVVKTAGPRGTCSAVRFDALGRMFNRRDFSGNGDAATANCSGTLTHEASWRFDTTASGVSPARTAHGKLLREESRENGIVRVERELSYDAFLRASTVTTTVDGATYVDRVTYDRFSRPLHSLFAAPGDGIAEFGEFASYNSRGYGDTIRDSAGTAGELLSEVMAMNARGQATESRLGATLGGANVTTRWGFDAVTGRLLTIHTGNGALQSLSYTYDRLGNMLTRSDSTAGRNLLERFEYDHLQRLTKSTVGTGSVTFTYDANGAGPGNLTQRSDLGAYTYGTRPGFCNAPNEATAGPHAVSVAGSTSYCYDAHGNQTRSSEGRAIEYTPFDLPGRVTHSLSGKAVTWTYGPNRERVRRLDFDSTLVSASPRELTHYIGSVEVHRDATGRLVRLKRFGAAHVTAYERNGSAMVMRREFLLTAAQGSTYAMISATGAVVDAAMSFDAFGSRRNALTWAAFSRTEQLGFNTTPTTRRGYTGHDQGDSVGLIHMNGRIYDPQLGRFVQADPIIQDPYNGQSFNRYTYVFNNPLAYTDPSGNISVRDGLRMVVAIAITVYTGGAAGGYWGFFGAQSLTTAQAFAVAVGGGIAAGAVQTGTLRGALTGGLSAAMFFGVGQYFQGAEWAHKGGKLSAGLTSTGRAAKILAHGASGGIMSRLQGGKFGHGFVSAGLTEAISPLAAQVAGSDPAAQIVAAAVVGGTVSELSGGKFANGAITAAFQVAFNSVAHAISAARSAADDQIFSGGFGDRTAPADGDIPYGRTAAYADGRFSAEGAFRRTRSGNPRPHMGSDFAGVSGDPVRAAVDAEVVATSRGRDWGQYIVLRTHDTSGSGAEYTVYAHLSEAFVAAGDSVFSGQVIGAIGSSGNASPTAPHLHFEVSTGAYGRGSSRTDPEVWLGRKE